MHINNELSTLIAIYNVKCIYKIEYSSKHTLLNNIKDLFKWILSKSKFSLTSKIFISPSLLKFIFLNITICYFNIHEKF